MPTLSAIKTPGVYVQEISAFPPSIAQVATAIPVFIGYTEFAIDDKGKGLTNIPFAISSMLEYTTYFGGPPGDLNTVVTLNPDNTVQSVSTAPSFQMFNALSMFFYNGGVDCYVLSVGNYPSNDQASLVDFMPSGGTSCFDILKKYDEPTLIVIPDASIILDTNDFSTLINEALLHCGDMQSRFSIVDVPQSNTAPSSTAIETTVNTDSSAFRSAVFGSNLNYGAAYYPYLQTNLPSPSLYSNIILKSTSGTPLQLSSLFSPGDVNALQIINATNDQKNLVSRYKNIPISTTSIPPYNVIDYSSPEDVTAIIQNSGNDISIADAYNSIKTVSPSKDKLSDSIKFVIDVLVNFVNLKNNFTDKPDAAGYYIAPLPVTKANTLVPLDSTIMDIHSRYIKAGTTTSLSTFEQLLMTLIEIDEHYPIGGKLSVIDQTNVQLPAWFGNAYLTITPLPDNSSIYGIPTPTTDDNAVAAVMPIVDNVFETLISMISNFASDVLNRLTALDMQLASSNAVYNNIKTAIKNTGLIVPPGGTMAGVYAATDGNRGVWKAPANVALLNVIKPTIPIDDDIQGNLNIDPNSGKSINVIRAFTGKGTLVWGARTLTGNDNDFKYIPVRRFFIMVEQSAKLASFQFVFEPNDANTWTRIRAMIENYLTLLWREGALAGAKPEQAFYVSVGLGKTMTFDDILNGRLIVEIGMAPVRPAEFIILRFTQIQQTS